MRPPGSVLWYLASNPAKRALQLMQIGLSHISTAAVKRAAAKKSLDSASSEKWRKKALDARLNILRNWRWERPAIQTSAAAFCRGITAGSRERDTKNSNLRAPENPQKTPVVRLTAFSCFNRPVIGYTGKCGIVAVLNCDGLFQSLANWLHEKPI